MTTLVVDSIVHRFLRAVSVSVQSSSSSLFVRVDFQILFSKCEQKDERTKRIDEYRRRSDERGEDNEQTRLRGGGSGEVRDEATRACG